MVAMAQPRVPFMAVGTMREANVLWIIFVGLIAGIIAAAGALAVLFVWNRLVASGTVGDPGVGPRA